MPGGLHRKLEQDRLLPLPLRMRDRQMKEAMPRSSLLANFFTAGFAFLLWAIATFFCSPAFAIDCTVTSSVCVDATPCKTINGNQVCLNTIGQTCWKYNNNFTCYDSTNTNWCSPLESKAGCGQYDSRCIETHITTGLCTLYEKRFDCQSPLPLPLPANITSLGQEFEIIKDSLNESACLPLRSSSTCWKDSGPSCIEPGGTRVINGLPVTKDCWKYQEVYLCENSGGASDSTCTALETDPACTEVGTSTCIETLGNGTCSQYERTFQCVLQEGTTETVANCSDQKFCIDMGGGNIMCFKSGSPADQDFGKAITALEMARQMGVYLDPSTMTIFNGTPDQCREGYFGLRQCCKTENVGGTSNADTLGVAYKFASFAGSEVIQFMGSSYVHDFLFASDISILNSIASLYSGGGASYAAFTGNFTVYGLEFSYSLAEGIQFVQFNPYMFAAAVAITVVMQLMECEESEQTLSLRRGAGLCEYVGQYCSRKVLGSCVERTKGFCCFNSRLAKIVSVAGHQQLGKTFGDPAAPDCTGFTSAEIELLDFSAIDFSEFITEITKNMPEDQYSKSRVTEQMQNYYDYGTTDLNENFYTSGAALPD